MSRSSTIHTPHAAKATANALRRVILALTAIAMLGALVAAPAAAATETEPQGLRLPFAEGEQWIITAGGTYPDGSTHGTLHDHSALSFDLDVVEIAADGGPVDPSDPVTGPRLLAVGAGKARLSCAALMAIVELDVDGHGVFTYLHLDPATLPAWLDDEWTDVRQGEVLGTMYLPPKDGYVEDWFCGPQYVRGAHLHIELPAAPTILDDVVFSTAGPAPGAVLESTNQVAHGEPVSEPAPVRIVEQDHAHDAASGIGQRAAEATCDGHVVTIDLNELDEADVSLTGTDGDDVILGTPGDDMIDSRGGDDVVCAGGGADHIVSGSGNDVVFGGDGDDVIEAGSGADRVDGGSGSDRIDGGAGKDRIVGRQGDDELHGGAHGDIIHGGAGEDEIWGESGDDFLSGGGGSDRRIDGGADNDRVYGGAGADLLLGGEGSDVLDGGAGNDELDGQGGDDALTNGGPGLDQCRVRTGSSAQEEIFLSCEA